MTLPSFHGFHNSVKVGKAVRVESEPEEIACRNNDDYNGRASVEKFVNELWCVTYIMGKLFMSVILIPSEQLSSERKNKRFISLLY